MNDTFQPEPLPTRRSLDTVEADMREAQAVVDRPLADLGHLEREIARLNTETILDASNRPALFEAVNNLKAAKQQRTDRSLAQERLVGLNHERDLIVAENRKLRAEQATGLLNELNNEFASLGKQLCRVYERLLIQQQKNLSVSGAAANIPNGFDIPLFTPPGWVGTTADQIKSGSLYWLNKEREREAA